MSFYSDIIKDRPFTDGFSLCVKHSFSNREMSVREPITMRISSFGSFQSPAEIRSLLFSLDGHDINAVLRPDVQIKQCVARKPAVGHDLHNAVFVGQLQIIKHII